MASSKTLTSGHGAMERQIVDGALTEQRMTPGTPRESTDHCGAPRSRTEDHGVQRSTCLFNDLFFISR